MLRVSQDSVRAWVKSEVRAWVTGQLDPEEQSSTPWPMLFFFLACKVGDLGLIPGLGRSPGEGKGYPLQYPGLENSMDCIDRGVTKSRTRLSDCHFHFSCE